MRNILRTLGARQSIGIGLLIIVSLIIVAAKVWPNHGTQAISTGSVGPVANATAPTGTGTGVEALDPDGLPTATPSVPVLHSPEPPVTASGQAKPQAVALSFAKAWVRHDNVTATTWLHAVTAFTTADLATQLAETDPENVPADRVTGKTTLVGDTATSCDVRVPTDTGTLVLTMQNVHGHWMVDDVDWDGA